MLSVVSSVQDALCEFCISFLKIARWLSGTACIREA